MVEVLGPPINPAARYAFEKYPRGCTLAGVLRVPQPFIDEAKNIVAAHRPPELPVGFDPSMALSDADFKMIDHLPFRRMSEEAQQELLAELRRKYKDDPAALIEILRHDYSSEFNRQHQTLMDAVRVGNDAEIARLTAWFAENHPGVEI